jgi:hypothetical protein
MATQVEPGSHHLVGSSIFMLNLFRVAHIGQNAKFLQSLTIKSIQTNELHRHKQKRIETGKEINGESRLEKDQSSRNDDLSKEVLYGEAITSFGSF